MISFFFEI